MKIEILRTGQNIGNILWNKNGMLLGQCETAQVAKRLVDCQIYDKKVLTFRAMVLCPHETSSKRGMATRLVILLKQVMRQKLKNEMWEIKTNQRPSNGKEVPCPAVTGLVYWSPFKIACDFLVFC